MGMINGVFPQKALADIGMPLEGLSQSDLLAEMALVPRELSVQCLAWYQAQGMRFEFGSDPATELTRDQVLEQCAMLIALGRFVDRFGLSAVGVQYQQGLARCCAASDFAEGAIGNAERFPIPTADGRIVRNGKAIPCINEVDMGTAIPQTMLWRLLDSLGLPAETTLHDIRWGSEFESTFYWDLEISGAVPFAHLRGGIAGATGYRQSPMYFPKGGSTITGQGKAGRFIWARAHYEGTEVVLHVGTGHAVELPAAEFERRRRATSWEWPLLNCVLDGVSRDQLMAGHQSNHITIAYVDEAAIDDVLRAFVAQALTQNMRPQVAGAAFAAL
jgi:L-fucose isomerase-like protein